MTDRLVGAVLLGGRSRRFGTDKALAPVGDTTMGALVVDAFRNAGIDPVVAVGGSAGPQLNVITVPDHWPGEGPLAALATVLRWARDGRVLAAPCDLPRLRASHLRPLVKASDALGEERRTTTAVVAVVDGKPRYSLAVWPAAWAVPLRRVVEGGDRRYQAALDIGPWVGVETPPAALADADSPTELDRLLDD